MAIDVISREHAEDIKKELQKMLGREKVNLAKDDAFQQRATAAKRVLENMTPAE